MATTNPTPEAIQYMKDHAAEIEAYEERTGNEFDPEGPALEECEDCGRTFQYIVDTEFGHGHCCATMQCEAAAAARFEDAAYGSRDTDDGPDYLPFEG